MTEIKYIWNDGATNYIDVIRDAGCTIDRAEATVTGATMRVTIRAEVPLGVVPQTVVEASDQCIRFISATEVE